MDFISKLKIISVIIFTIILSYFSISNFTKFDDSIFNRNINLGLDLQGGSYLLLEIDNSPVIEQKLQNKLIQIKKFLKDKNILYKNLNIVDSRFVNCTICLEPMYISDTINIFKTDCDHYFHNDCIMIWLREQRRCPICRCSIDIDLPTNKKQGIISIITIIEYTIIIILSIFILVSILFLR